ncbi:MAG: ABC transporter permease [Oscillatoriales cyanobacterium]|nr:MAG: ABC transporter permease [Oscillatoriales cyanobacterium]
MSTTTPSSLSLWSQRLLAAILLGGQVMLHLLRGKIHRRNTLDQMAAVGPESLLIALLTAGFVGMVFTVQVAREFINLGAGNVVGGVLALSLTDPIDYLVIPRVLACCLMLPILTILSLVTGIAGGLLIATTMYGISQNVFLESVRHFLTLWDICSAAIKAFAFGGLIAVIGTSWGLTTTGGAKGVGQSTTTAVVTSLLAIFIVNFFLTWLMFQGTGSSVLKGL